ncbi:MAG TPA: hypothetical protein DCS55_17745, partial [Acidimicrobiaceae bacterium]|nr:hypothetical protein [Acidimicrobiaceae bacterium]
FRGPAGSVQRRRRRAPTATAPTAAVAAATTTTIDAGTATHGRSLRTAPVIVRLAAAGTGAAAGR